MSTPMTALRAVAALCCFAAGALILLFWGVGISFWSLIGLAIVAMAFGAGFLAARGDYVAAATPSAVAGVIALFIQMPPAGFILLADILLFIACALAFVLYEVD
jgi:hypothetical protein